MLRNMLKSKIHRTASRTANCTTKCSCAIDEDLLEAANIVENEWIDIWNINNGECLSTYAIKGSRDHVPRQRLQTEGVIFHSNAVRARS
jgi:aspartate 1-decarboxylase